MITHSKTYQIDLDLQFKSKLKLNKLKHETYVLLSCSYCFIKFMSYTDFLLIVCHLSRFPTVLCL